jgi:hypothetical protein
MALLVQSFLLDLGRFSTFLILYTIGRTPWTGHQSVARPLPTHRTTQTQNKHTQTSMPWVGFEPTIPAFERAKTVHASDHAATVIGATKYIGWDILNIKQGQTGSEWMNFFFGLLSLFVADPCSSAVSPMRILLIHAQNWVHGSKSCSEYT